jgi:hypothetical protein
MFGRNIRGHKELLRGGLRRGRLSCDKGQLEVADDTIDHGEIYSASGFVYLPPDAAALLDLIGRNAAAPAGNFGHKPPKGPGFEVAVKRLGMGAVTGGA